MFDNCSLSIELLCLSCALTLYPSCCWCNKDCNWERVPNGTLPKLGRVPTPLWEKPLDPLKKKRTMKRGASLLLITAVSSCESACCRWVFVWQKLCTQDLYGSTLSSFTGSHSAWLTSFVYRCISLDTQELYHLMSLIGFGIGQASVIFG